MYLVQVGRLLIWAGLSEHMDSGQLRGEGYTLIRSERGKPMLLDGEGSEVTDVGFNISHQVYLRGIVCVVLMRLYILGRGTMLFWPQSKGSRVCVVCGTGNRDSV